MPHKHLNFGLDVLALRHFAKSADGYRTMRDGVHVNFKGKRIRLTVHRDGTTAKYDPRIVLFAAIPPMRAAGENVAREVADIVNEYRNRHDIVGQMVDAIDHAHSYFAGRYAGAQKRAASVYPVDLLEPSNMRKELSYSGRTRLDLDADPACEVDTAEMQKRLYQDVVGTVAARSEDEHKEADYIYRNLDNGNLSSSNYVGYRHDEAEQTIHICFAISQPRKGVDEERPSRLTVTVVKGEPKAKLRSLTSDERRRYMDVDGDLSGQTVWVSLNDGEDAKQLKGWLEDGTEFACLRELMDRLLIRREELSTQGPTYRQNMMDAATAVELVRAEWNDYIAQAELVFQLATQLIAGELNADDAAARIPPLFRNVWVVMERAPGTVEDRYLDYSPKLRDAADFIAVADHKDDFYRCLHNRLLASESTMYRTPADAPAETEVRKILNAPFIAKDDAALRQWITGPRRNDIDPINVLLGWRRVRISKRDYVITMNGAGDIRVQATDRTGSIAADVGAYERELGEFLTARRRFTLRVDEAYNMFREKFRTILEPWRAPVQEEGGMQAYAVEALRAMAAGDATDAEALRKCFNDEQYRQSKFIGFEKSPKPDTFVAVFRLDDGTKGRLTLSANNIPGVLSGDELKRRLKIGPPYMSLAALAAQWLFEQEQAVLQRKLLDAVEESIRVDGAVDADLRNALVERAIDISLAPFGKDQNVRSLLTQPLAFSSLDDVMALIGNDERFEALQRAGSFVVAGRSFTVQVAADGGVSVSDLSRSFVQTIKAVFGVDDAARLTRVIRHQAEAKRAAEQVRATVDEAVGHWFETAPLTFGPPMPRYLYDAIMGMTQAADARDSAQTIAACIDDPFFCDANFKDIQPGPRPQTFTATFANADTEQRIVFSNIESAGIGGLQGSNLATWLARGTYQSFHDMIRKWTTRRAASMLAGLLGQLPEANVAGHTRYLAGYCPLRRSVADGAAYVLSNRPLYAQPRMA